MRAAAPVPVIPMQAHSHRQPLTVLLAITAVILLAFWLRLDGLGRMPPGISNDEAVNAVDAFHFSRTGNFPMYEDQNRPEPLYRVLLAVDIDLFGTSVWSFRFFSVLIGTLTIAAVYQTTCECVRGFTARVRWMGGIAAAAALAVALGHITESRIIERGTLQLPFMLLFASFLLRGVRTGRLRDYVISGVGLGISYYTYTAALVLPATLGLVAASLLIFQRKTWWRWLIGFIVLGVAFVIVTAPISVLLLNNPQAVLGRAAEVQQNRADITKQFLAFWGQFWNVGDENPQYNVASAPLLPPIFVWLFFVGLVAVVGRFRRPSSALIVAFLLLSSIPVIAANEVTHGLRIMGEFGTFPLVIGVGVSTALFLVERYVPKQQRALYTGSAALLVFITGVNGVYAHQTYSDYWARTDLLWKVEGRDLPHGEWFYRTDRRDLGEWLAAQNTPLLVPVDELSWAAMRTWLMPAYPAVKTAGEDFQLPANTRLVVTWALELGDLRRDTRQYALLNDHTITLLPPLSTETHEALLKDIDSGEAIRRDNGVITLVGRVKSIPADFRVIYEPRAVSGTPIAVFGDQELQLVGWHGSDTLTGTGKQTLTYTLDWQGLKRMGHEYSAFVQLQTQDEQKVAGDDVRILRWLFPTTAWETGDVVPDVHTLEVPGDLQPGAYRLVTGMYVFVTPNKHLPIFDGNGNALGDSATIGWVKVPQRDMPTVSEANIKLDARVGKDFALRGASVQSLANNQIQVSLYWESLTERTPLDATIFVHAAEDNQPNPIGNDARPWQGQYPTFIWGKGEIVRTDHVLDLSGKSPDDLTIYVGMYTFPSLERLAVVQDGAAAADNQVTVGKLSDLLHKNP